MARSVKLDAVIEPDGQTTGTAEGINLDEMTPEAQEACREAIAGDCYRTAYNQAMKTDEIVPGTTTQKGSNMDARETFMQKNRVKHDKADARASLMAHSERKIKRDSITSREALMQRMAG